MKKLYTLTTAILFSMVLHVQGQQFTLPNTTIPVIDGLDTLQNAWAGGLNAPLISEVDANLDGLKDLYIYVRSNERVTVFLNDGSTTRNPYHYDYNLSYKFPQVNAWALMYDYDNDGKDDFFTLSPCNCGIAVYRNTSTASQLQFTLITGTLLELYMSNPVNVYASSLAVPAFSDIDNDGDMDILGYNSVPDGRIQYHRNYSVENYGVDDSLSFKFETATWGFFKLQIGGTNTVNCYTCRTSGTQEGGSLSIHYDNMEEADLYQQSSAAARDDSNTSIFAIDLDGDNDKEVLIGDITAINTLMVCNGGTPGAALMDSLCTDTLWPSNNTPIQLHSFTSHAYIDVDNDGKKDLLVTPQRTENKRSVWFYKNNGTTASPVFNFVQSDFLISTMIDEGEGGSPVFFDYNNDGYFDMVVANYGLYDSSNGSYRTRLSLYRNNGSLVTPSFTLVTHNYAGVQSMNLDGPIYPSFGDLNNDNVTDMVLGSGDGKLYYFAGSGNPVSFTLTQTSYFSIDVGNASTPQLVDLNNDGKLDFIIGEQNGFLNYYENLGTVSSPAFLSAPTIDTLGGVNVRTTGFVDGYAVPFVYYDNGDYQLWVSCSQGDVYKYDNIGTNLYGVFALSDTLIHAKQGVRLAYNLAVTGTYIDNDGLIDMALGVYGGGVTLYTSINPLATSQPKTPSDQFILYPNPAAQNITLKIKNQAMKVPVRAELFNSLGQVILATDVNEFTHTFDVSSYPSGLYFMKLTSDQDVVTQKFFVSSR